MTSDQQPSTRNQPGRWLYIVPALFLAAALWTALAQRAGSSVRPSDQGSVGVEAATDQFSPTRFRVVGPNLIEDTATGVRRTVQLSPGEDIPERFTENLEPNENLVDDRRYGIGPRPVRVLMSSIGLDAEAIPIGLDANRAIAVPRRADITGWWSGGHVPGEIGPTVIVGHFDSKVAPGVFSRLPEAKVGQFVIVEQSDGSTVLFRVTEVEKLKKSAFPTQKVYGATDTSTLRLVTCGGRFDRSTGHYVDNLIVYAEIVPQPPGRGIITGFEPPEYFPTTTTTTTTLVSDTTVADSVPSTEAQTPSSDPGGPPTSVTPIGAAVTVPIPTTTAVSAPSSVPAAPIAESTTTTTVLPEVAAVPSTASASEPPS